MELLSRAEPLIDELLDWDEQTRPPNVTQSEAILLKSRKQLGEHMALTVSDNQDAQRPAALYAARVAIVTYTPRI